MTSRFFESPAEFRKWLEKHHATAEELWVGFYKKGSGKASMTWPESVAEALCFGWIDAVRKSLGDVSYTIRFTRRKPGSIWSAVNIRHVQRLVDQGLMQPAGLEAFEARTEKKSRIYSYEQKHSELDEPYAKKLRKNKAAWEFFRTRPAWYRKKASWWVVSAKKEETRLARLEKLIANSAKGRLS
jgi:uncharacterized protein YdeI (YjbR/CyaY-like superfamily)